MVATTPCGLHNVTMHSSSDQPLTRRTVYPEAGLGAAREIVVQWTTKDAGSPVVRMGTDPSAPYTITANATSTTYLRNDMCGSIAATCGPRPAPNPTPPPQPPPAPPTCAMTCLAPSPPRAPPALPLTLHHCDRHQHHLPAQRHVWLHRRHVRPPPCP